MKNNTKPKLHISLSKEHNKYQLDVVDAFKGMDVSFDGGLMRFSTEEMAMQIMLNLGLGIASSAMWDGIKVGIKKLHKKFNTVSITLRDSESVMYTVKPDLSVTALVVPDRMKEFEYLKTLDDLINYIKNKSVSINSIGWEETKLTDIGIFSKGSGITKNQLTETGHNAVRYGELYTKFDFKIEKIYSHIPTEILPTTTKIKYGDILLAGSGETNEEIGKSAAYLLHEDCYAGGDLIIFSPKNTNSLFLSYFLNIGEGRKKLSELGQGQSVVHIYKSGVEKLKLHLPPLLEQDRIVTVIETWDMLIEKLSKKIQVKKQLKKGLMQDLLTGKRRLIGFKDEWEIRKLRECLTIKHGKPQKEVESPDGEYPILGTGGEFGRSTKFLYDKPSVLIGRKGTIDKPKYIDTPFWTVDTLFYSEIKKNYSPKFLYYVFLTINWKLYNEGSGVPSLSASTISSIKIKVPKEEKEQEAIAHILTTTDKEIAELEKKLSIIKEQKKYLLNNLITGTIRTPETLSTKITK